MKNFDYYFSNPTQSYFFNFRILFSDAFKGLSVSAKALYALMVERANLSNHNNWFDDEKRVYIIYTASQVMDDFQCSEHTALKLLAELTAFGLIERFQNKKGQAYIIYVKLYNSIKTVPCDAQLEKKAEAPKKENKMPQEPKQETSKQEVFEQEILQEPKRPLRAEFSKLSDYTKAMNEYWIAVEKFDEAQNKESASPANNAADTCKNCSGHLQKLQSSNINSSNINSSIYKSYQYQYQYQDKDKMDKDKKIDTDNSFSKTKTYSLEEANAYRELIKKNIEYFAFQIQKSKKEMDMVDNIVEMIVDVMTTKKETIRIAGEERNTEVVKSVYSKLNLSDIDYVMKCITNTESEIRNIVSYTRTALYNAKQTRELHHSQHMLNREQHYSRPVYFCNDDDYYDD